MKLVQPTARCTNKTRLLKAEYKNRLSEANALQTAGFLCEDLLLFVLLKIFH